MATNADGKPTESHYRIELPRSNKAIVTICPNTCQKLMPCRAYTDIISGHSKLLDECTDIKIIESDIPFDELERIMNGHKVIHGSICLISVLDLLRVKKKHLKLALSSKVSTSICRNTHPASKIQLLLKNNKAKSYK